MKTNMGMNFNRRMTLAASSSCQMKDTGTDYDHEVDNMRVSSGEI